MEEDQHKLTYPIDVVMCVDSAVSMGKNLERIKRDMLRLPEETLSYHLHIDRGISLRIKAISYGDIYDEGKQSTQISPFYKYPEEK